MECSEEAELMYTWPLHSDILKGQESTDTGERELDTADGVFPNFC